MNNKPTCTCLSACLLLSAAVLLPAAAPRLLLAAPQLSDRKVADKIEDELRLDAAVNSARVDVAVSKGIATLTGQVDNLLAKERAARIAAIVRGVRSVVNRLQVQPPEEREDSEIVQDIESALLDDPATNPFEIAVSVKDGMAAITGTVESYQERELVRNVVKGVRGVQEIRDQLVVQYDAERPDATMEREIEQTLRWNVYVDDNLIDVEVRRGKVVLSGTVGSAAEKNVATTAAWVAGVSEVDNSQLQVARWARDPELRGTKYVRRSEAEIREAILAALQYDPRVRPSQVDVKVTGSVVTLRGNVDHLKAKRAAEQDARNTVGTTYVNNRLKVRPQTAATDAEIAGKIEEAFQRDPYIERQDTSVVVVDGVAHLYGTADSRFARDHADDVASRVRGVTDVSNYLEVDYDAAFLYNPYVDEDFLDESVMRQFEPRAAGKTDAQIRAAIQSELWWSPFVDSDTIQVAVDNGVARLTGFVQSAAARRAATENAYEGGATLVDNDLKIDY